jgi:hypothetical protein
MAAIPAPSFKPPGGVAGDVSGSVSGATGVQTTTFRVGTGSLAARQSAITAPTGGGTVDAEARTAINTIITALETFGLVTPN